MIEVHTNIAHSGVISAFEKLAQCIDLLRQTLPERNVEVACEIDALLDEARAEINQTVRVR